MKKIVYSFTIGFIVLTLFFCGIYVKYHSSLVLSLTITFGTISYHFVMRLLVGFVVGRCMHNKADYTKKWYQSRQWEKSIYEILKVRYWKNYLPTFEQDYFNLRKRSFDQIAQSMCQAEVVHEVIVLLCFIPVLFSIWFNAFWVFMITSFLAACFDLAFVIMQRYNRPRVIKLIREH